jgi:hypothetical protein
MKNKVVIDSFKKIKIEEVVSTSSLVYGKGDDKEIPNNPVLEVPYIVNKHLSSPLGNSILIQFFEDNKCAGHIFLQKRSLMAGQSIIPVFVASDLVSKTISPAGGLILFREAIKYSASTETPLINFSNKKSDPLYSKILKKPPLLELDFRVQKLNYKLAFNLLGFKLYERLHQDNSFAVRNHWKKDPVELIEVACFDTNVEICVSLMEEMHESNRDFALLNWRFHPQNRIEYKRYLLKIGNLTHGYLVLCERTILKFRFSIILDYVGCGSLRTKKKEILKSIFRSNPSSIGVISISNSGSRCGCFINTGGYLVWKKFLPNRVKFYFHGLSKEEELETAGSHLTLFDTDIL